jgi:hypothetical protein
MSSTASEAQGPYHPAGGPIPLHRYRRFKKTKFEQRADHIEALAAQLQLPKAALEATRARLTPLKAELPTKPFVDPDPFHELAFRSALDAKRAIADYLALPIQWLRSRPMSLPRRATSSR